MKKISKVAIIGGTGMIGQPVARQLIAAGFQVSFLTRDVDKVKSIFGSEVHTLYTDLHDEKVIETCLQGMDALYINLSIETGSEEVEWHAEKNGLSNALIAAKKAKISRILYLSSYIQGDPKQHDWWVFRVMRQAVASVRNCGIPYTIFRPSSFMETLAYRQIKGNKLRIAIGGYVKNYYIAGDDYGKMVAISLTKSEAIDKEFVIQGPEPLDNEAAAHEFITGYTHEKLKVSSIPLWLMELIGRFSPEMAFNSKILRSIQHYPEPFQSEETWELLGRPTTTMKEFASKLAKL